MKEIFEYYLNKCNQAMIHEDKLSFEFGNYFIEYTFTFNNIDNEDELLEDDYFSYNRINNIQEIDRLLTFDIEFQTYNIIGYEYLGWREDSEEGRSITYEMFCFIERLKKFNDSILNYDVTTEFGDPMCHDEGNYQFKIEINDNYFLNNEFAKSIIDIIKTLEISIPDFYTVFFRKKININDNKIVSVLSTNTKVRRLGYFKIMSNFFNENKKFPASIINKKFEDYCSEYKNELEDNSFKKGLIIKTKSGVSAKPYIDTALDINLLSKVNNVFNVGKSFKVYQNLKNKYSNSNNIFELTDFDKVYFLECILKNDFFYFSNLLELFFLNRKTTYLILVKKYQAQLILRLEDYKRQNIYDNRKVLKNIDVILKRINNWEKAEVYLEHIIMPRINWMLDFDLLTSINNEFILTEKGLKLFKHLCVWNDINTDKIISSDSFIDRFMIHTFDDCYKCNHGENLIDRKIIIEKIYYYIDSSFDLFKTLAPNRVTASQAANYTKYKLYLDDNIKVGYQFILGELSEKEQDKFVFKYQEQYQDGYIQRKK
ncbi:hypothetical protein NJT12_06165 [Flavobacterium sp. AC]|uniref:Uncharacterized protein n=2 Tax=Flavobacterium azizsancarii TaxID=2961580 RepID=A0ABT4W9G5_9FLAO|nr:hypothetical protein [Flavobacterium azizsancarii]